MAQSALNVFRFCQRIPDHWSATFAERHYRDGLSDGVARNGRWMFGDYGPPWPSFGSAAWGVVDSGTSLGGMSAISALAPLCACLSPLTICKIILGRLQPLGCGVIPRPQRQRIVCCPGWFLIDLR
jgi:hypothetical protein